MTGRQHPKGIAQTIRSWGVQTRKRAKIPTDNPESLLNTCSGDLESSECIFS
jgi:hypothetical protein